MKDKKIPLKKPKAEEPIEKIPLSQVIHVDIDDEVSSIFERITKKTNDLVYLVVPYRAVLFQSIINVKILKRKVKDCGKEIAFITKDKSGVFFANKCNIPVFDQVSENKKEITTSNIPDDILTAADREKSGFTNAKPTKSDKPKSSIAELVQKVNLQSKKEKLQKFLFKLSRKKGRQQYTQKLLMSNPNRTLLIGLTFGSLALLSLITYIALPNATITLKANTVPIEHSVNITLADAQKNAGILRTRPNRVIASYPVNPGVFETVINYDATGSDLTGENARGIITVYNKVNREFPLVPYTRFQTADGMIFRTQGYVSLPAGSPETPSQLEIEVVADVVDINNTPVGERGNLALDTKLTIPGLTNVKPEDLYATVKAPFVGGVTSKDRIVTTADIQAAKDFAAAELRKEVPRKLQEYLVKYNAERNLNLSLMNDSQLINIGEIQIVVDESIVGQKMNQFTVTARAETSALAYDQNEFIQILKNEITLRKSPDKSLSRIDETGVTTRVLSQNPEVGIIEVTATISGVEQFNLSDNNEAGKRVIQKITTHIAGFEVGEAKQYIESLPEIETADITTWPFWAPTIPSRAESIKIQIDETQI